MADIKILDCTLRDGGYVNKNTFGYKNIGRIIDALNESGIDIIECGYFKDTRDVYSNNITEFTSFNDFKSKHQTHLLDRDYTLMLLGEEYKIENLPQSNNENEIIRMSFHKKSVDKAIRYAKIIQDKGYKLFLQPTVTVGYNDEELDYLLDKVNEVNPYCVAIVDTFGQMRSKDVERLSEEFNKKLNKNIAIGFHAHNNLQLAFSNAITFLNELKDKRTIIIDTSIYGMGRGAGNLPTELVANYLNENHEKNYKIEPILKIVDDCIAKIKNENDWGYSLEYYLSAINGIHPSYIISFLERKTLNTTDINELIKMIPDDKKAEYDKNLSEDIYNTYNEKEIDDTISRRQLEGLVRNKKVLLIGPGKSIIEYSDKINKALSNENTFSIAINGNDLYYTDATFYSNKKRYAEKENKDNLSLLTSNIKAEGQEDELIFDYSKSLSNGNIKDNSLLIMLNILKDMHVEEINLVGFDGFSKSSHDNFYRDEKENILTDEFINRLNKSAKETIKEYRKDVKIKSLTPTKYMED